MAGVGISGAGVDEIPMKLDLQRFLGQTRVSDDDFSYLIIFFTMLLPFQKLRIDSGLGTSQCTDLRCLLIWCQYFTGRSHFGD